MIKTKPKPKFYYDLKVSSMIPATVTYRIFAESPEQAVEIYNANKNISANSVQHKLAGKKDLKIMVYDAGCSIIKYILNIAVK
jgi:hypothetical protein